jgi:hypothetical protein
VVGVNFGGEEVDRSAGELPGETTTLSVQGESVCVRTASCCLEQQKARPEPGFFVLGQIQLDHRRYLLSGGRGGGGDRIRGGLRRDVGAASEAVHEMIRWPGAGELHLAVAHHGTGCGEFVLIALHVLAIDEMGDIENHLAGLGEAAAYFFIEGNEEAMHLKADGAGAGLAFALARCRFAEIGEIAPAHLVWRNLGKFTAAAVVDKDLEVHLGFAAEFIDVAEELTLVGPDGFAQAFVVVEYGAEAKRKDGGMFEAVSDDASMIHTRFLIEGFCGIVFADNNG